MTYARFSGPTSVAATPHLYDSSSRLCAGVADMAEAVQGVLGPMGSTSIVISDNMIGVHGRLMSAYMAGESVADAVSKDALTTLIPNLRQEKGTQGFLWLQQPNEHAVICLSRKTARAISDPSSRRHIKGVATLAHEMGHIRAIRAGYDLRCVQPKHSKPLAEDFIAGSSIEEYLAVRAEVDAVDKLYGRGFETLRASSFARFHTKKIAELKSPMHHIKTMRPRAKHAFLMKVGYNIGTLNGYLDGFRAASAQGLPARTDQLKGLDERSARVLNLTRGGLAGLQRSLEASETAAPLLRRAAVDHGHAIESVTSRNPLQRIPRRIDRGLDRD